MDMSHFPELRLDRRRLAGLAAATGVLPLLDPRGATAAAPTGPPSPGPSRRYRLHRESGSVVSALDLPIAGDCVIFANFYHIGFVIPGYSPGHP